MPSHRTIELRFLREGENDRGAHTDDIIKIVKLGENSVRVVYHEHSVGGHTIDTMMFNYGQLIGYLYRVFWLLGVDDDPFKSVQLFIPGMPSILISVATLQKNVGHILEMLLNTCYSWPHVGRDLPTPTPSVSNVMESVE
jgi:hypothetical protein